jgi:flagellar hook-associated protein 2
MALSAINGFIPALSLIDSLNPIRQTERIASLRATTGVGGLLSIATTQASFATISDLGRLLNDVETLRSAAAALLAPDVFVARTASITASGDAPAAAAASAATPVGSYALQIDQLAQAQTLSTAAFASSLTAIGSGVPATLDFDFASGASRRVALAASDNTLAEIAAAINAAEVGIDARVVNADGFRLALTGHTGAGNAFTVAVDGDATLAGALAYPPGGGSARLTAAARDAQGTIDGIAFSAGTNEVNTPIAGLALKLLETGTATVNVAVNDEAAPTVSALVDAYNGVQRGLMAFGASNLTTGGGTGGFGFAGFDPFTDRNFDTALSASLLAAQLSATLNAAGGGDGNPFAALARVGITRNVDGTLSFDERTFQSALNADQAGVAAVFANDGEGLAAAVAAQADGPLSPAELLPEFAPALSFGGTFTSASSAPLLAAFFGESRNSFSSSSELSTLSSSLSNQIFLAGLIGTSRFSSMQTDASLVDQLLAQLQA